MQKDERDLLDLLRFELKFLEDGGYGRSPKTPWKPQFVLEDSPTCVNFNSKENRAPCTDCALIQLVPPELRSMQIPCRHIPLNAANETLDSLYRCSDQHEVEEIVAGWLRGTIDRLEQERTVAGQDAAKRMPQDGAAVKGTPLYQKQHPKCANPACPTPFHWTGGGKFFRFRPERRSNASDDGTNDVTAGIHGVKHYWLCERCSQIFTLIHDEQCGVVLRVLWPEIPGHDPRQSGSIRE